MALPRRRKTAVDSFVDAFLALDPGERLFAMAALRGAERALGSVAADPDEEEAAADLGKRAVEETGK